MTLFLLFCTMVAIGVWFEERERKRRERELVASIEKALEKVLHGD